MRSRINLRQFEAFRAVCLTESFTAAGQYLNITQPAVSKLVADLEFQLGFSLFNRAKGKISATAQAKILFEEFEKIHSRLDKLVDLAGTISPEAQGVLKVAALPIYADTIAPEIVKEFRGVHDDVFCVVDAMPNEDLIRTILAGEADVGITSIPTGMQSIRETFLHEDVAVLAVAEGHRLCEFSSIPVNEIGCSDYIALPLTSPYRQSLDLYFSVSGFQPNVVAMCRTQTAILRSVSLGIGVSVISRSMKYLAPKGVRFIDLNSPCTWNLGLIAKSEKTPSPAAAAFFETAVAMKDRLLTA